MKQRIVFLFLVFFLALNSAFGIEVIKNYNVSLYVTDNYLQVNKTLVVYNQGDFGIVPGDLLFRVRDVNLSQITDYVARDEFGNRFDVTLSNESGVAQITVNDYVPIFSNAQQIVFLSYKILLKHKSMLFFRYDVPLLDTTLPIDNGTLSVSFPSYFHLTYEKGAKCDKLCSWNLKQDPNVYFELSYLPFPRMKVPAENVFWYFVIFFVVIAAALIAFFAFRRKRPF